MIGILCTESAKKEMNEFFLKLVKDQKGKWDESIVVITISDIDFNNNEVNGCLISDNDIQMLRTEIPRIIFNMSVQKDISSIKGRKLLEDMEGVKLLNPLNRYDQWMLMEILSSSPETKKYLMPYHIYNKKMRDFKPEDDKAYIVIPARGSKLSRMIFAKPEIGSERVGGTQYFKKGHICDYIDASLCQKRWIFIEAPELMMHLNSPNVVRVHLQKGANNDWNILGKEIYYTAQFMGSETKENVDIASLTAVMHINHYLHDLGYCFIDFVISKDGDPYFIHFGGFNLDFFRHERSYDFYKDFYRNLMDLTGCYSRRVRRY